MRVHEELHSLTGAYALDALPHDEREVVEAHLAHCAPCRDEVAGFAATAGRLAGAVAGPAPRGMRDSVMHGIDSVRQMPPRVPASDQRVTSIFSAMRRTGPLLVAAGIVVTVTLAGVAAWQHQRSTESQREARQAARQLEDLTSVMSAPDVRTVQGRTTNGASAAVITSRQLGKAVFVGTGLPRPASGRTYQLWYAEHGTMRPAGLLEHDGAVAIEGDLGKATAVGLTIEPAGGSPQPTTAPLMLLTLPA
ncbi:anti-sigma factor domain-containing protein [Streptomyces sp. 35G-GA-8]|uniref:anti-sigma factor n=1 Tax=Streptomyces sp. 35G-GA-8 TaxID=2939434 RepID=UPI00201F3838|nr:anti-sigma factor [Streptomyces sp. 35G-GA-8]MCL7376075.1 anti-sigma factor [Streptomyces sp. 35G-GA-8]